MGSKESPFASARRATPAILAACVCFVALVTAGRTDADTRTVLDGTDVRGPLDLRSGGHGHAGDAAVTATVTTWSRFGSRTLTGPNVIAVGLYRRGFPYRWIYVSRGGDGLRAVVKQNDGTIVGPADAFRPNRRSVRLRIREELLGDPAGYHWVAFSAYRDGGSCARYCTDAVRGSGEYVKTGVLRVSPTLHDIAAPSIRLLRFPDPSTRQSATLRYRVEFSVRDSGGAGLRRWRLERRPAGASVWTTLAEGTSGGRHERSLVGAEGRTYEHRVYAVDGQGNRRFSRIALVSVPFDDADAVLAAAYEGAWQTTGATSADFRATLHSSSDPGARLTYAFNGSFVAWIGPAADGVASVDVDGGAPQLVDLASFTGRRRVLFRTALSPGDHTLTIAVASGTVGVDGLVARDAAATTAGSMLFSEETTVETAQPPAQAPVDVDGLDCSPPTEADLLCPAGPRSRSIAGAYHDSWRGWPVAPLHKEHPIRGSFLDPRPGGFHFGVDISVRDDRPEQGAPRGRTHRVYAVEGGTVSNVIDGSAACNVRRLWVGHFAYYHVDAIVAPGQHVGPGQMIGWTCRGEWHVHLSEVTAGRVLVNPLHRGGKLSPYTDTKEPVIEAFAFYKIAPPLWTNPGGWMWSPASGTPVSPDALSGVVDVRVSMRDPQSFRGWLSRLPTLYADLHPYRAVVTVIRESDHARVYQRELFDAYFPYALPLNNHYAPGTRATRSPTFCFRHRRRLPVPCGPLYWVHAFGGPGGAYWNTRTVPNGRYRIRVTAWDPLGHVTTQGATVRVSNA